MIPTMFSSGNHEAYSGDQPSFLGTHMPHDCTIYVQTINLPLSLPRQRIVSAWPQPCRAQHPPGRPSGTRSTLGAFTSSRLVSVLDGRRAPSLCDALPRCRHRPGVGGGLGTARVGACGPCRRRPRRHTLGRRLSALPAHVLQQVLVRWRGKRQWPLQHLAFQRARIARCLDGSGSAQAFRALYEPTFNAPETRVHVFLSGHVHAGKHKLESI